MLGKCLTVPTLDRKKEVSYALRTTRTHTTIGYAFNNRLEISNASELYRFDAHSFLSVFIFVLAKQTSAYERQHRIVYWLLELQSMFC